MAQIDSGLLRNGGVIKDIPAYDLPLNFFSDIEDVIFTDRGVQPAIDEVEIFRGVLANPLKLVAVNVEERDVAWIYLSQDKAYQVIGEDHREITRSEADGGTYSATEELGWNNTILHGIPLFNNGVDLPQQYDQKDSTKDLVNLENFPSNLRVLVLRAFKTFLIGISLQESNGFYDTQTIIWSDSALPGQVPSNWDFADPASRAGIKTFSETPDRLVDGLGLGEEFLFYKENSVWAARFVGGTFVFSFKNKLVDVGILSTDCVVQYNKRHFVVTQNDIITHNGIEGRSVIEDKNREFFFQDLNSARKDVVYVVHNEFEKNIWVFYPSGINQWCDKALIWDYTKDTWTFRNVPQTSTTGKGVVDEVVDVTWDDFSDVWGGQLGTPWSELGGTTWATWNDFWSVSGDNTEWNQGGTSWDTVVSWDLVAGQRIWDTDDILPNVTQFVMASNIIESAVTYDETTNTSTDGNVTWSGTNPFPPFWLVPPEGQVKQGRLQRLGLTLALTQSPQPSINRKIRLLVNEIWPEIPEGNMQIRIGNQETQKSDVDWEEWQDFDSGNELKLDTNTSGKFIAIELRGDGNPNNNWLLTGYMLETIAISQY